MEEIPMPRIETQVSVNVHPRQVTLTFQVKEHAELFKRWLTDTSELSGWSAFGAYVDSTQP
jgi:hypothetical protein